MCESRTDVRDRDRLARGARGRHAPGDLARRLDAVEQRHGDVDDGDVGLVLLRLPHGVPAVAGFGDDAPVGFLFEYLLQTLPDEGVIVREEHPDLPLAHGAAGTRGPGTGWRRFSVTTRRVPRPGRECRRSEPPTSKELNDTKSHFVGSFASERETPQQMASELWMLEENGLQRDFFENLLERVGKVDAAACQKLVQETIDPSKMVVVVVGNASKIQAELEKIAPVKVVKPGKE